jgi:hypothetical protein
MSYGVGAALSWLRDSQKRLAQGLFRDACFFDDPRWEGIRPACHSPSPLQRVRSNRGLYYCPLGMTVRVASFGFYYVTVAEPRNTEERRSIHVFSSFQFNSYSPSNELAQGEERWNAEEE